MITQKYDLHIYPLEVIEQAKQDFSQIAKIFVAQKKHIAKCYFLFCVADEQQTVNEFSNYLIDLIGSKGYIHENY